MDMRAKRDALKEANTNDETENIETVIENIDADTIVLIDENLLDDSENDVFSMLPDNKFQELKSSIARNGVLSPLIIRAKGDGRFQILSGRNRRKACKELGILKIPCVIKNYDDIQAELVAIETNLAQRENISPVEKGKAYRKQLELLKKMKKENNDFSSDTNDLEATVQFEQLDSIDQLSANSEDGRTTIQRLIRLTNLIEPLQNKVTNKTIPVNAGVELSYIPEDEQNIIETVLNNLQVGVTIVQAESLRAIYGTITEQEVIDILTNEPKKKKKEKVDKFTGKIEKPLYKKYKDKFKTDKEFTNLIEYLLEKHFENTDKTEV